MFFDLLFLLSLFLIGIVSSYTDIKYGKIKNLWILIGFIWGILVYIGIGFYTFLSPEQSLNFNYLFEAILNTLIAFLVGYLFWNFDFWAAGDAKLFTLFSFLIPLSFYSKGYFSFFPSLGLLINFFIPLVFFFSIKGAIFVSRSFFEKIKFYFNKRRFPKELFSQNNLKKIGSTFFHLLQFIVLIIIFQVLMKKFHFLFDGFGQLRAVFFLIFLGAIFFLRSFLKRKLISFFIILLGTSIGLYLIFMGQKEFFFKILKSSIIFLALFLILRFLLNFYIENKETKKIKIKDLKEGITLSRRERARLKKKLKGKTPSKGFLGKEEVDFLKKSFEKEPGEEIEIYKNLPFAPFLFLASLITILTQNLFSSLILKIMENIGKL